MVFEVKFHPKDLVIVLLNMDDVLPIEPTTKGKDM